MCRNVKHNWGNSGVIEEALDEFNDYNVSNLLEALGLNKITFTGSNANDLLRLLYNRELTEEEYVGNVEDIYGVKVVTKNGDIIINIGDTVYVDKYGVAHVIK